MSKTDETLAAILFIGIFSVSAIAQTKPEAGTAHAKITISVHDYMDIPLFRLAAAETEAQRIFALAGVETAWLSCSAKWEESEPAGCSLVDSTHLVLKVVSGKTDRHTRDRDDVLGRALLSASGVGYYAYAFLDHIDTLEQHRGVSVLGYVLTHEIGHLLLGSNSHSVSGIMSPHWNDEELRRISEGTLLFLSGESHRLRERLQARKVDLTAAAEAITGVRADTSDTVFRENAANEGNYRDCSRRTESPVTR